MTERLFIYGTLAPGRSNEHVLAGIPGGWEPASVRGTLHEEGWGAPEGYPALVLDEAGDPVRGFLFTSDELASHWRRLDAFEGEGYERVVAPVRLADGATVRAYLYVLRGRILRP